MMIFLQLSILSHVLSDFFFQSDSMVDEKTSSDRSKFKKGHFKHGAVVFLLNILFLLPFYKLETIFLFSLSATFFHYFIDIIKYRYFNDDGLKKIISFIADQLLHIAVIVLLWSILDTTNSPFMGRLAFFMPEKLMLFQPLLSEANIVNFLNCLIVYIYVCWGGSILVSLCVRWLGLINGSTEKKEEAAITVVQPQVTSETAYTLFSYILPIKATTKVPSEKASEKINFANLKDKRRTSGNGKYIGIFERLIIVTLVLQNQYAAIGFVFTAKSLARANELVKNDRDFAEYYLIGTLLSTSLAIFGGLFLKYLLL